MTGLDVGVFLPTMTDGRAPVADVAAAARHAEGLGFESAWVVDQLIAGEGVPVLDSIVSLAAAAAATERINLGLGVLVAPLRNVVWLAKQVASLQHVSRGRLLLGVGVGGERHRRSWAAAGVPRSERGRRTDDALDVLPDLVAGRAVRLGAEPHSPEIRLAPAAPMPELLVGGMSDAAIRRIARYGDAWFLLPGPSEGVAAGRARLAELAAAAHRPTPAITASTMAVLHPDPAVPEDAALRRSLSDPDGMFGIPPEHVDSVLVGGDPPAIAAHVARLAERGAERVAVTLASGDWFRQAELLAEARDLLPTDTGAEAPGHGRRAGADHV
ncbi:LLM class flavin-dependent oxidoreductase [Streptomonospora alba]|uniref:LLM class flavin-dependent oxidoreductase n=1 Tax=Streptomonospora alba TaxID=183763 RepID=UPI00069B9C9F|nr:LLM class flavin-dependent oxidoreductase [Streptomonospora alba]